MPASIPRKSVPSNSARPGIGACLVSTLIYLWMGVWSTGYFILALLPFLFAFCLPKWHRRALLRWIILGWGIVVTRLGVWPFIRLTVSGEKPVRKPSIYVFNHRSGSDAFLVSAMHRPMIQAVNGWPMRLPVLGFVAKQAGYLDITNLSYEQALAEVREHLEHGVSVIDFPEGHRSASKELLPFQSGAFRMARDLGVDLYPGVITGNEENPTRHFRLKCGRIHFHLLPPISANAAQAFPSAFAFKQHVRNLMAEACAEHEVYP
ncbi:MAG: 1-acyl-sn-glycerol-3-phosphate acyltransferase [Victivallales bacterium]|nr:1-acyl-sn-glycerol-3-phosphate acyltransferase [Victivallales bacterium]